MLGEIRALTVSDWESVRDIYRDGITTGQATFETELPSWESWDSDHLPFARLVAVAERNGAVQGWAALSPVSTRSVYAGVAEVSIYVAQDCRNRGLGGRLLKALCAESERQGIWTLQASMFPENIASAALHRSCGFREVGMRHRIGKLQDRWRDTMLMERRSSKVGID